MLSSIGGNLNRMYESSYVYLEGMRAIQVFCCDSGLRRLVLLTFGLPSLNEFGTDIALHKGETDKRTSFAVKRDQSI